MLSSAKGVGFAFALVAFIAAAPAGMAQAHLSVPANQHVILLAEPDNGTCCIALRKLLCGPHPKMFRSPVTFDRTLRDEQEALWSMHNRGEDELTVVSSEYLEVIAVRA
jgi:hypothetical protein